MPREHKWRLLIAFAALYLIWGSTYLGIAVAIETIPPFTMAAVRFLSHHADTPKAPLMATGSNMLAGSVALAIAAVLNGEPAALDVAAVSLRSLAALAYLIVVGAIVGFTAYIWLLRNTTLAKASTYAYVNPGVAVFLGWLILGEAVTARTVVAAAVIIGGVVMISVLPLLRIRLRRTPEIVQQAGD